MITAFAGERGEVTNIQINNNDTMQINFGMSSIIIDYKTVQQIAEWAEKMRVARTERHEEQVREVKKRLEVLNSQAYWGGAVQ